MSEVDKTKQKFTEWAGLQTALPAARWLSATRGRRDTCPVQVGIACLCLLFLPLLLLDSSPRSHLELEVFSNPSLASSERTSFSMYMSTFEKPLADTYFQRMLFSNPVTTA